MFNGNEIGQIGVFPGSRRATFALLQFDVPVGLLTGSDTVSLVYATPGVGEGFAINYSELDVRVAAIPEPETYAMLLAGLGLLGFAARRRKQTEAALA